MTATFIRSDSSNNDFKKMVSLLDEELVIRDGNEHSFYHQFNKPDDLKNVIVGYVAGEAVAIGAFKEYAPEVAEIKRMFVLTAHRGRGVAFQILQNLESWAVELNYAQCILETGKKQPEAIALYKKSGYEIIPNYGQYQNVANSVCMKKSLIK
jgi:GNAT superfamily N-acetyltransferase